MDRYSNLLDNELVSLLKEGNHSAYTEVYKRYHSLLIVFAIKKLNDDELAKDLIQEVFVKLWVKRSQLNNIQNLPAYLITSVKHKALDLFEHENVKSRFAKSLAIYSSSHSIANADYLIREKQFNFYVDNLIAQLPEKMQEAFILSKMQHYSNKEIANNLSTSESNVSKHVHNALRILKLKLYNIFI